MSTRLTSQRYLLLRRNDDHDDQRQNGKEQAEDPPAERVAALHRGDNRAHDGGDDASIATKMPFMPLRMNPAASG
jgi:hypothetical protein